MNILLVTSFAFPHEGGLSTHVQTLKDGLEARGNHVDVLSFSNVHPFIQKTYAQAPGFLLNRFKLGAGQLINDKQRMKLLHHRLRKLGHRFDVINTQDTFATLAAVSLGKPVVATVHGYYAYEAVSRGAILENSAVYHKVLSLEKTAYEMVTNNITVDQRINDYIGKMSERAERVTVKNFINVDLFCEHKLTVETKRIIFVPRRLTQKNGVIYPLMALPKIVEIYPNTQLVYAGSGEELSNIQAYMKANQLEKHVTLLGSVDYHSMLDWYKKADVVIVPSIHSHGVEEATSIAAIEAMASGTPVIASAIGGLKQIISSARDGLLVEQKNPEEIAQAVSKVFSDQALAHRLGTNAREKIRLEYSHVEAAKRFEQIYKNAIQQGTNHA